MSPTRHIAAFFLLSFTVVLPFGASLASEEDKELLDRFLRRYTADLPQNYTAEFQRITPHPSDSTLRVHRTYSVARQGEYFEYTMISQEPDGVWRFDYSWNGDVFVRFGRDNSWSPNNGENITVFIGKRPHDRHPLDYPFELGLIRSNTMDTAGLEAELASDDTLTIGIQGRTLQKVYFSDVNALRYRRIESFDGSGNLVTIATVGDWRDFEGISLPTHVHVKRPNGEFIRELTLLDVNANPSHSVDGFIVPLPYAGNVFLYNDESKGFVRISSASQQTVAEKRYFDAWEESRSD